MNVWFSQASGGSFVGCCGLLMGVGSFDMKFVAVDPYDEAVLKQLVLHAEKHCKANGADQVKPFFLDFFLFNKNAKS
jgi:hypothetical protein